MLVSIKVIIALGTNKENYVIIYQSWKAFRPPLAELITIQ